MDIVTSSRRSLGGVVVDLDDNPINKRVEEKACVKKKGAYKYNKEAYIPKDLNAKN